MVTITYSLYGGGECKMDVSNETFEQVLRGILQSNAYIVSITGDKFIPGCDLLFELSYACHRKDMRLTILVDMSITMWVTKILLNEDFPISSSRPLL